MAENWINLNKILTNERNEVNKKRLESQKLVELCSSSVTDSFKEIKDLLKKGAHINCFEDMATPLIAAIRTDNIKLGEFLLKIGASINYSPEESIDNAFWEALKSSNHIFLEVFVGKKCLLTRDSKDKILPLIYATQNSDFRSVEILLRHYAIKVNQKDQLGNTALHYNVSKDPQNAADTQIGKLLVAAGAEVNGQNLEGKTPKDMALDYTVQAMLLSSKLEKELEVKEEPKVLVTPGISRTSTNKVKI